MTEKTVLDNETIKWLLNTCAEINALIFKDFVSRLELLTLLGIFGNV